MANLVRKQQKIFAENSQSTQVTAFRTAEGTPLYTKDVDEIQNANFSVGWLEEDNAGNVTPYAEDMNGVFYSFTRNLAYLYQKGIPEWSNSETYYTNAMCMYDGVLYQSLADDNTNRQPDTQTSYWQVYASPISGSIVGADNLGTGAGISTGVASSKIQLKSLVAGTNVTLTESSDSITIDATGGSVGSVAWGDITGSLASQVDLSMALSQRGTLSGNNTWTGTNTVRDLIPSTNSTYDLGSSTYAWQALYTNYIFSNSSDHLVIGNTDDLNRILINYTSAGSNWGIFPDTISGTNSYLGDSVYPWDYAYIDTATLNTNKVKSDLTVGQAAVATALRKITLSGYSGSTDSTLTQWATFGFFGTSSFAFNPYTTDTGYIGSRDYIWNQGYFSNTHTTNIYATYDAVNTVSKIGLYYNTNATETSPTQWGWMGYLSATEIGIFPSTTNSGSLGGPNNIWNKTYSTSLYMSANNIISDDPNSTGLYIGWRNASNTGRYVRFDNDEVVPTADNIIDLGTTSTGWRKSAFAEILPNTTVGVLRQSGGQYYNEGLKIWCESQTSRNWYVKSFCFLGGNPSFAPANNNTIYLGTPDLRWKTIYTNTAVDSSDRRIKDNIEDLENAIPKLNSIAVKSFTMNDHDEGIFYGFIAQDELERNPELVVVPYNYSEEEDGGKLGFVPNNVLFLAVKAIQELSAEVEDLKQQIKELKK